MRAIDAHRRRSLLSLSISFQLLSSAILLASSPAAAKIAFHGPSRHFPVASPSAVAIADLDRDGHADLVVTNGAWHPAGAVSIMRGREDGTFETPQRIPLGIVPEAVVVEDLDGDGLLDVAATHHGFSGVLAGYVAVLLGNGDGTFRAPVDHPAGYWVRSLRAVDLDGDQDLDLVTENVVLLGNGDGTFAAPAVHGTSDSYAAVGDVNRDGRPDIVTTFTHYEYDDEDPYPQACALRLGNGDGTFQGAVRFGRGTWCRDLEIADVDQDGLADVVVANYGGERGDSSGVMLHRGRGDGSFEDAQLLPTALNPMSIAVADLNGDGRLDLITANNGNDPDFDEHSLTILLANGDGTFERQPELHTGENPRFVAVGRLDANEALDLVVAAAGQSAVTVFVGNGDGTFGSPDRPLGRRPWGMAAEDFDRDGTIDLATTNFGSNGGPGGFNVIKGRGDGTFGDPLGSPSLGTTWLVAGHLDGDLTPDLVVGTGTGFSVMLGNGDGTFRELGETFLDPRVPGVARIGDFDRDGRMDLVVPHGFGAPEVSILLGRGDGSFGPISRVATGGIYPGSAAVADLNGDAMPDLVVGDFGFGVAFSVLLGRGDGTFLSAVTYPGNLGDATHVGLADLDEDGRLDVLIGNLLWRGNGDGTLRDATPTHGGSDENGLILVDFDGDHHVDAASLRGRIVSVYPGRGDGTFGPTEDYGTGRSPGSMTAGDFDGDGRIDLAVGNYGSGSISILLNRSVGPVVPVRLALRPAVVVSRAETRWITAVVAVDAPRSWADLDVASIRLNGTVPVDPAAPVARSGGELVVRFDRAALAAILPAGDALPVTITGQVANDSFEGTTTVRVLGRGPLGSSGRSARHSLRLHLLATTRADAHAVRLGVTLAEEAPARLDMLDVAGRVVATRSLESFAPGTHEIELSGTRDLAPGIYFVRFVQGNQRATARTVFLR